MLSVEDSTQVPPLMSSWNWSLPMSSGTYHALFPRYTHYFYYLLSHILKTYISFYFYNTILLPLLNWNVLILIFMSTLYYCKLDIWYLSFIIVYNRSWSVYECPVPGIRVCIRQVSPFLPHSYSEASLPVTVFHVEVENIAEGT